MYSYHLFFTSSASVRSIRFLYNFKGLDLIDRMPEELWTEVHDSVQEAVIKTIPKKKKCEKAKWPLEMENNRMRKTRDLFKKIRDAKGRFHANTDIIKDRLIIDTFY